MKAIRTLMFSLLWVGYASVVMSQNSEELTNDQNPIQLNNSVTTQTSTNPNDEVTMVVIGEGTNKEEAIKNALHSAIEQVYGAFVSANTTRLNDDVVKDEIATISSGNVKNYTEVASATLPNNRISVIVKATVCISKLVSYAKSKGSSTEFAGASFGMNMKIKEYNKKNEEIALQNLREQIKALLPTIYETKLTVEDPRFASDLEKRKIGMERINYADDYWIEKWEKGAKELGYEGLYRNDISDAQAFANYMVNCYIDELDNGNYYIVPMRLDFCKNNNYSSFIVFLYNSLKSISLNNSEIEDYNKHNIPISSFRFYSPTTEMDTEFYFRNSESVICEWLNSLENDFGKEFSYFRISDNVDGPVSEFFSENIYLWHHPDLLNNHFTIDPKIYWFGDALLLWQYTSGNPEGVEPIYSWGTGFFSPFVMVYLKKYINIYSRGIYNAPFTIHDNSYYYINEYGGGVLSNYEDESLLTTWMINCIVHKDKISQYTKFEFKRGKGNNTK